MNNKQYGRKGFFIERKRDGMTFSEEALYSLIQNTNLYINKVITAIIQKGFETGEPVYMIEMDVDWKANGEHFDDDFIFDEFPKHASISLDALAKMIVQKAKNEDGQVRIDRMEKGNDEYEK